MTLRILYIVFSGHLEKVSLKIYETVHLNGLNGGYAFKRVSATLSSRLETANLLDFYSPRTST
jgi:hypothetical protein